MLQWVLVILTAGSPDQPHLAVTSALDQEDCAAKADVVSQILTAGGYEIIDARCAQTSIRMTPYRHAHTPDEVIHTYQVTLPAGDRTDGLDIVSMDKSRCQPDPNAENPVYCAVSAQKLAY